MFTGQKNLELTEIVIFLDYVYTSLLDALELAEKHVGSEARYN